MKTKKYAKTQSESVYTVIFCCILIICSIIVGVGLGDSALAQVKLSVWSRLNVDRPSDLMAIEAFKDLYPEVEIEFVGHKQEEDLIVAIAAGVAPDVALILATFDVPKFAHAGLIQPLDRFLEQAEVDLDEFAPGIVDSWKYAGKTWAMSYDVDIHMVHWHQGLFSEAGLDPDYIPSDLHEFDSLAHRLTRMDESGRLTRVGFVPWLADWPTWAAPWDVEWWDAESETITADQDNAVAMFEWIASYAERYGRSTVQQLIGQATRGLHDGGLLIGEYVVMHLGGPWVAQRLMDHAPNQQWGHGPLPYPEHGLPHASTANALMFVIPTAANHPEEAFEFIRFYTGLEQSIARVESGVSGMPVLIDAARLFVEYYPVHRPIVDVLVGPHLKPHLPLNPVSRYYRDQLVWAFNQTTNLQMSPRGALEQVREIVQLRLDEALER